MKDSFAALLDEAILEALDAHETRHPNMGGTSRHYLFGMINDSPSFKPVITQSLQRLKRQGKLECVDMYRWRLARPAEKPDDG